MVSLDIHFSSLQFDYACQTWDFVSGGWLKVLGVPAVIFEKGNGFFPTENVAEGIELTSVNYISGDKECVLLNYGNKGGLITLENYDWKVQNNQNKLEDNFYPFPSFIDSYYGPKIAVSDDQQFISITSGDVRNSISTICCYLIIKHMKYQKSYVNSIGSQLIIVAIASNTLISVYVYFYFWYEFFRRKSMCLRL